MRCSVMVVIGSKEVRMKLAAGLVNASILFVRLMDLFTENRTTQYA